MSKESVVSGLVWLDHSASSAPANAAAFTSATREMRPGQPAVFSDAASAWALSTGYYTGDRRQASHWKDNNLSGTLVGVMDPTLAYATVVGISRADIRALDLIGHDVVPEPSTVMLLSFGLIAVAWRVKQSRQ